MKTEHELYELLASDPGRLNNLCRICLCEDGRNSTALFSSEVRATDNVGCADETVCEKMMSCGRVRIQRDDKLPKVICGACHYDLDIAHLFRLKCQQADALLRKVLQDADQLKHEDKSENTNSETKDVLELPEIKQEYVDDDHFVSTFDVSAQETKRTSVKTKKKQKHNSENIRTRKQKRYQNDEHFKQSDEDGELISNSYENVVLNDNNIQMNLNTIKEDLSSAGSVYDNDDTEYIPIVKKKRKRKTVEITLPQNKKRNECLLNVAIEEKQVKENCDGEMIESLNGEKYTCELCGKVLSTKYIYIRHMKSKHGENRKLSSKQKEGWLVTGKGVDKRFHCPECDYKSRRSQGLQYHMATHTGARPYKCDQCPQSFTQHGRLYAHKKSHSDKTYYTCAECGKQFKHRDSFNKHKNVHNPEMNFICHICNKALKTQKTLNEHIDRHLQIKRYSCEFCGLAFVTRVDLKQHSRVHNGERKYKCTCCDYSSYSKGSLEVHIKRHTGERNFQCEYCNYSCFTRGTLKFHIRKHTKEQNYACPVCDMKFRQSTSVNTHMLKKHGEKFKWNNTVDRRVVK